MVFQWLHYCTSGRVFYNSLCFCRRGQYYIMTLMAHMIYYIMLSKYYISGQQIQYPQVCHSGEDLCGTSLIPLIVSIHIRITSKIIICTYKFNHKLKIILEK